MPPFSQARVQIEYEFAKKSLNTLSFCVTMALNGLSASGAISGLDIGEISDRYITKITPAGYAFSIWSVIYFCLALFVVLQWIPWATQAGNTRMVWFGQVGWYFVISNVLNSAWILVFVWGTPISTWLAVPLLFAIMGSILMISKRCQFWKSKRPTILHTLVLDFGFSVYAGWTTVASIVNVATAGVSVGWTQNESIWSVVMLCIAALINVAMVVREGNVVFACVYSWAAFAISQEQSDDALVCFSAITLAALVLVLAIVACARHVTHNFSQPDNSTTLATEPIR